MPVAFGSILLPLNSDLADAFEKSGVTGVGGVTWEAFWRIL